MEGLSSWWLQQKRLRCRAACRNGRASPPGLPPEGGFGHGCGSGVQALAGATAGSLLGHVLVGGGLEEAGVGVLLHQRAGLGLGFVEASGGGPREVLPGDLPGFVVDVHLQGRRTHKR